MPTQKIIDDIRGLLRKGKPVPSGDVRALLYICDALTSLVSKQQHEIADLKAALPKPDPKPGAFPTGEMT